MIKIGIGSLVFSIFFVILVYGKLIGLSALLFLVPFLYFFIYILEKKDKIKNSRAKLLLIPILLLSSTYFLFDNSFFYKINLIVIPILFSIMVLELIGEKFELNLNMVQSILGVIFNPLSYIGESISSFSENVEEKIKPNKNNNNHENSKKIFKSILITIPIVILILILLSTADETFANFFEYINDGIESILSGINLSTFIRLFLILIMFLYFMGLFYYILFKYEVIDEELNSEKRPNEITVKMIMISLNIIYLIFCITQIKSIVSSKNIENYSHYARQGFFQLMIVSIINLITILVAKRSENKEKNNKFINNMCLIMIFFTFIIVISAGVRMYFYENAYGYTLLRLLVYCTLFTEILLFIPTIIYIFNDKLNLFKAYSLIIIIVYVSMNFLNFDNLIAKRNVDRCIKTGKIDLEYLENKTGANSVNQVYRLLDEDEDLDENTRLEVVNYFIEKYDDVTEEEMDIRDFNISKLFSKKFMEEKFHFNRKKLGLQNSYLK